MQLGKTLGGMRIGGKLAALATALLLAACEPAGGQSAPGASASKAPASVSGVARGDIEAIVKAYLLEHPEVLDQALAELDVYREKKLFEKVTAPKDDPFLGPKDAPITVVEYFDYNCGYCREATPQVMALLNNKRNDVKIIFKEMPILHQTSLTASKAAVAAARQGKYREMHVALMKSKDLSDKGIDAIATSIGLNVKKLRTDMETVAVAEVLTRVAMEAQEAEITGTPAFLVNGKIARGSDLASVEQWIEEARKANK